MGCVIELMLMNANWSDVLHGLESIGPIIGRFKVTSQGKSGRRRGAFVAFGREKKMDGYRIMQIGHDFVVSAGDVSILKCQTEKEAQTIVAAALDILENPDEWWSVLRQRLAASDAARLSSGAAVDITDFDVAVPILTPNVSA
jgi:hypothetical protein